MRTWKIAVLTALVSAPLVSAHAQVTSYTWTGSEPTLSSRLYRDGNPSTAGSPKSFPGTLSCGTACSYTTFTFVNPSASAQAFTFALNTDVGTDVFFAAYNGSFSPSNFATNYLGDEGSSCGTPPACTPGSHGFSVTAPGSSSIVIFAEALNTAPAGSSFSFTTNFGSRATTTPEPTSLALLGTGLAGLVPAARMRRKR